MLPAGPGYPGRTAGPSFELFYESDYVLPHREAAWILLTERLRQAAEFCEPGGPCDPPVTDGLREVRSSLAGIADALAAHLPPRYVPETPVPAEDLATLLARAEDFYRTALAFASHDDPTLAGVAALMGSTHRVLHASQADARTAARLVTDARTAARLVTSVLRPLAAALPAPQELLTPQEPQELQEPQQPRAPQQPQEPQEPQEHQKPLWDLAVTATTLRASLGASAPPGLLEAVAALQDLAVGQARPSGRRRPGAGAADRGSRPDPAGPAACDRDRGERSLPGHQRPSRAHAAG